MALAAKHLGEATSSCHVRSVGEWPCDEWDEGADKSAKGDDPKSGVHFRAASSGTNAMLDGGLVMFG
jgi:hypothetical protein